MTTYYEATVNTGPPGKSNFVRKGYGIRVIERKGNTYYFDGAFSAQDVYLKQIYDTEFIFGHYYCI